MGENETTYILELTNEQAKCVKTACEFYARMRFGQFQELPWDMLDVCAHDFCERRDAAEKLLFDARKYIFPELKGREHSYGVGHDYRADSAWEIYEAVRYAIAWHENPDGGGTVDYDTPMHFSGACVPKCYLKEDK